MGKYTKELISKENKRLYVYFDERKKTNKCVALHHCAVIWKAKWFLINAKPNEFKKMKLINFVANIYSDQRFH